MLIDWVTMRVPLERLSLRARELALQTGDRIRCYCPRTGEIHYETYKWESLRSDSHQIAVKVGTDLWVQGSPTRVIGDGDSVFSSGASQALDVIGCVTAMIKYVQKVWGIELPKWDEWLVSRVDITGNLMLDNLADVRIALNALRGCEGGRYRVSQVHGDTVYWSARSKLRSGKAYAKGAHLQYLMTKRGYDGYQYDLEKIALAQGILRLELRLGREWFRRHCWKQTSAKALSKEWETYFNRMIGDADMINEQDLLKKVTQVAPTEGIGRSAFGCWAMIQSRGWEQAREYYSRTTWYRNLKVLKDAGLGDIDISSGRITPIRRKILKARLVNHWSQLAA